MMTFNSILRSIKTAYQKLLKQTALLINNAGIRNRIQAIMQTVLDFARRQKKVTRDYFQSDDFIKRVSAVRKFIFDSISMIKARAVQLSQNKRFGFYLKRYRSKAALLVAWITKKAKLVFSRETFEKLVSQGKTAFTIISQNLVAHKRLSAAVALILLVFLIWPGEPELPEPDIQTIALTTDKPGPKRKIITLNKIAPDFTQFAAGQPRKKAFFDYFSPLVEKKNRSIIESRNALLAWHENDADLGDSEKRQVQSLAAYYRINNFDIQNNDDWKELLARVNAIPTSLALAQAANESAWGTSRFAREANNFYGQWCFQKGCGLVPAKRDKNKTHEVAAFKSPEESVERYIHNLNSHKAYRNLRNIRRQLRLDNKLITGIELAEGLLHYSERGEEYINELQSMIKFNKLTRYD